MNRGVMMLPLFLVLGAVLGGIVWGILVRRAERTYVLDYRWHGDYYEDWKSYIH